MKYLKPTGLIFWILCFAPIITLASGDCPVIVDTALTAIDLFCQSTGRNQACYGNIALEAEPYEGVEAFEFENVGDIIDVTDLQSLRLSPMDEAAGEWGVALMRLQANLPDTLPGQNVTFLLFGDVEIESAVPEGDPTYRPMQAFYMKTGIGDAPCAEAPESGLLVQTPEGVGEIAFSVNGVEVQMGSTVFFQGAPDEEMRVTTVEGAAYLRKGSDRQVIVAGTQGVMPLRLLVGAAPPAASEPAPSPRPTLGTPYDLARLKALPLRVLERKVEIHAPLTEEQISRARELLDESKPLCGEDPFPPCHELPTAAGGEACVFPPGPGDPPLPEGDTRPLCEELIPEGEGTPRRGRLDNVLNPPPDDGPCVHRPRPGDPPLPATETRPFCEDDLPVDDRPCVYPPRPGDPPLPATETRPFCDPPQPPDGQPQRPPAGDVPRNPPPGDQPPQPPDDNSRPPSSPPNPPPDDGDQRSSGAPRLPPESPPPSDTNG